MLQLFNLYLNPFMTSSSFPDIIQLILIPEKCMGGMKVLDNHLYNLMEQIVEESKSLWRIKK